MRREQDAAAGVGSIGIRPRAVQAARGRGRTTAPSALGPSREWHPTPSAQPAPRHPGSSFGGGLRQSSQPQLQGRPSLPPDRRPPAPAAAARPQGLLARRQPAAPHLLPAPGLGPALPPPPLGPAPPQQRLPDGGIGGDGVVVVAQPSRALAPQQPDTPSLLADPVASSSSALLEASVGPSITGASHPGEEAPPSSLSSALAVSEPCDLAAAPSGAVSTLGTFVPSGVSAPSLPRGAGARQKAKRREGLNPSAPYPCVVAGAAGIKFKASVKGGKHAAAVGGPWLCALLRQPPLPPTGVKRVRAGLADVPLRHEEETAIKAERAARALVALLPYGAASFILCDSDEAVAARSAEENAERIVRALQGKGEGSLSGAGSFFGRLLTWVRDKRPDTAVLGGSDVSDFFDDVGATSSMITANNWLRDHCGVDLPARAPLLQNFRGLPPSRSNNKEAFSFFIVLALEWLSAHHSSPFVRGHAAAWHIMAKAALRSEQALNLVINSVVLHPYQGQLFSILVAAARREKHPDPSKRRPRPVWAVIDGIAFGDAVVNSLRAMLDGAEEVRSILIDTDSPSGDPALASRWLRAAPSHGRVVASLHSLLQLEPLSFSREEASKYMPHSAKRFMLCVSEASPYLDTETAQAHGRFSKSTAQNADLEPRAAMLARHDLASSALPSIYANKAKVAKVFDHLARAQLVLQEALARSCAAGGQRLPHHEGFSQAFAIEAPVATAELSLIQDHAQSH